MEAYHQIINNVVSIDSKHITELEFFRYFQELLVTILRKWYQNFYKF